MRLREATILDYKKEEKNKVTVFTVSGMRQLSLLKDRKSAKSAKLDQ